ncbi:DUF2142 domain-containing protein [Holdemanella biformis]
MGNRISKYLKNIDIKKCIIPILVLFVILNTFMVYQNKICRLNEVPIYSGEETSLTNLSSNYDMEFNTSFKTIKGFKLYLNSNSDNQTKVNVSLLDENKNVLAVKDVLVSKENTSEPVNVMFDSNVALAGEKNYIDIKSDSTDVAIEEVDNHAKLTLITKELNNFQKLFRLIGILFVVLLIVIYLFKNSIFNSKYISIVFVGTIFITGLIYSVLIPIGNAPDEALHMNTAYYYSNEILHIDNSNGIQMRQCDTETFKNNSVSYSEMTTYISRFTEKCDDTTLVQTDRQPLNVKRYAFTYIPQALGISVGRILHLNTVLTFYLAKLFNLISYSLLVLLAFKITNKNHLLLYFVASLPMTLQQAGAIAYDSMTLGLSLCVTAIIFELFEGNVISKKKTVLYVVLCVLLLLCKQCAYIAVALLPLMLMLINWIKTKYVFDKDRILNLVLKVIPIVILIYFMTCLVLGRKFNTSSPLYFALNPMQLLKKVDLSLDKWGVYYFRTLFTGGFGTDELQASQFMNMFYFAFFVYLIFAGRKSELKTLFQRICIWCVCLITTYGLLYVFQNQTPLEWGYIWGIQGRYFAPVLVLFMYSLSEKGSFDQNEKMSLINLNMFLNTCMLFELFFLRTML